METVLFVNIRPYKVERVRPIYAAKQLGYRVAVIADEDPGLDPGMIDDLIIADTYDMDTSLKKAVEYAGGHCVTGVMTWTDKDVELTAKIAEALNLPGISVDASKKARNKYLMREALKDLPDISPKYKRVRTLDDLKQAVETVGRPGIFKPVGGAGSKGIFKVDMDTDIQHLYAEMVETASPEHDKIYTYYPDEYVYEEYLEGAEISVDGVIQNDTVYITGAADNLVTDDYSLDYLEVFPSEEDSSTIEHIKETVETTVKALGFNHCAFHLEGRLTPDGFKIIEVAGRPGGGFIATHVIEHAAGVSYLEFIIKVATGQNIKDSWPEFDKISTQSVCHYEVLAEKAGTVKDLRGLDDVIEDEDIIVLVPLGNINDEITLPPKDFETCYLATAVLKGENFEGIKRTIARLEKKLTYRIE